MYSSEDDCSKRDIARLTQLTVGQHEIDESFNKSLTWKERKEKRFKPITKENAAMMRKTIGALSNQRPIALGGLILSNLYTKGTLMSTAGEV